MKAFLFPILTIANNVVIKNGQFQLNGQKLFLSGSNQAWFWYGYDFGNSEWWKECTNCPGPAYQNTLDGISRSGGNSMRMWLHPEGENSPLFDTNGYVIGTDQQNSLIYEFGDFLNRAQSKNILVTVCLWNGAVQNNEKVLDLFWDDEKLQSYVANFLIPIATAFKSHPALLAWEIINEPEGIVYAGKSDPEPCFDTTILSGSGAGWDGKFVPMKNILNFINKQASAIKAVEGNTALVTSSTWSERSGTDQFGYKNYYSDECLVKAGGKSSGTLDFYQMHTYSFHNKWSTTAPYLHQVYDYGLDKPLVIGEMASVCSENNSAQSMYTHFYTNGYDGAWSWMMLDDQADPRGCSDGRQISLSGIASIAGRTDHGIISINL